MILAEEELWAQFGIDGSTRLTKIRASSILPHVARSGRLL